MFLEEMGEKLLDGTHSRDRILSKIFNILDLKGSRGYRMVKIHGAILEISNGYVSKWV